ncbi:MAG: hypothetical protein Q8M24_04670 [Pseudolabrys sp.]|nr:hypothetical protein [Pseudolabrys sp.]MDP2294739.1 hypothetical protein [Pseudolabrys sp.]
MAADLVVMNGLGKNAQDVRLLKGVDMRIPPDKRSKNASKKSVALVPADEVQRANDHAAIEAKLENNPFHKHNTAGGRIPPYMPEYANLAKAMCERGATLDELAEIFRVSPKTIRIWQISHNDFSEACQVAPGCVERVKRNIFDIAMGQKVVTERIADSGSGRQITKVTTNLPANLAASKSFVPETVVKVESDLRVLLRQISEQRSMFGIKYTGPDGKMMSEKENIALGGSDSEIDWSNKSPEELSEAKETLRRRRQKP